MKKPEWMTKKYWIFYFIFVPCSWIIFIGTDYYKKTHPKTPDMISALDIREGEFDLFSKDHEICGSIKIDRHENNNIIIDMTGNEIQGEDILNKSYILKEVKYKELLMEPIKKNNETYYLIDSGSSYIILLKIRKDYLYFINNYTKKSRYNLYMITEVSYENYESMLNNSPHRELQVDALVSIDTNRYSCFFEQEKQQKKINTFLR